MKSNIIINNTQIDEEIEQTILKNTTNLINENIQIQNNMTDQITDEIVPQEAKNISKNIVRAVTSIVLFVLVKLVLSIVISLLDSVANLPILRQFNEVGGILYGLLRGILMVCVLILVIGVIAKINPENTLNKYIQDSYLTKIIYENIVKF